MFCRIVFSIFISLVCLAVTEASAAGWSWDFPPHYVNPTSAKRNHLFYVGEPVRFSAGSSATRFEVRDYYGTLLETAAIPAAGVSNPFDVHVTKPGWYKLYLYGDTDQGEPWRYIVGGTTFVIFRNDANFPSLPAPGTSGGAHDSEDEILRGVTGMGPQRLYVNDASNPTEAIQQLEADIALDKAMYLPFDPLRKRALMVCFPNGTSNTAGVRQIVEHFQNDVQYWEGRNEPDQGGTAGYSAMFELRPFYQLVKSVSPNLKVMAPGVTSIGPSKQNWIKDYLKLGKGYFDVFSFHAYNSCNGDPWLTRQTLVDLQGILNSYGIGSIEKWQTEQGYMAAVYGSFQPRLQGRWTMLQMMIYEQNGIPKEHNHLWYDRSHGFWDFPMFWENEDGSLNPAASLMRVYSEELFGTTFVRAYDFGTAAQNLYIGSLFSGPGKKIAAFMSGGNPQGTVRLAVTGGDTVRVVSPFGEESAMPVVGGVVQLPVSELPTYVRLTDAQTCEVIPPLYGENLALRPGVTIQASGSPVHPSDSSIPNSTTKLVNGRLENWYYSMTGDDYPWMSNVTTFPATIEITLPQAESVSDMILYSGVPWQNTSTLLDYQLQYWDGTQWVELSHVNEPTKTWKVYTPPVRCTVDSFFSDRWIFEHHFAPVTTSRFRLIVNDVTYGGGATKDVQDAGGQTGNHQVVLREIEIRKTPAITPPQIVQGPVSQTVSPGEDVLLSVQATGGNPLVQTWTKNGVPIPNGSGPTLQVAEADLDAQGEYRVIVSNGAGSVTSAPAVLTVATPFSNWATQNFTPERCLNLRALMEDDDDHDGINNLAEYVFGTNPQRGVSTVDANVLPRITLERQSNNDWIVLSVATNPTASDVPLTIEANAALDAQNWQTIQPDAVDVPYLDSTIGKTIQRFKFLRGTSGAKYFRLKMSAP